MSWLNKAVIYQIFVDRFAGFDESKDPKASDFMGGKIKAITKHLPYIKDLGATAIWLTPFYKTSDYHGYTVVDYFNVDPRFGTNEDLKELIDEAHKLDIKMVADFVPNHVSWLNPIFQEAKRHRDSSYHHWFKFTKWPDQYASFFDAKEMPKLNLNNKAAREYLYEAATYQYELGFDGLRVDHIIGVAPHNVKALFGQLRKDFPEKAIFGEAWFSGKIDYRFLKNIHVPLKHLIWFWASFLGRFTSEDPFGLLFKPYIGVIDGVVDFEFSRLARMYVGANNELTKKVILQKLRRHLKRYDGKLTVLAFLDNHDTDRILYDLKGDINKLKEAAKLQFEVTPGQIIYYGTEIGMNQDQSIHQAGGYGDANARQPMIWDPAKQNTELLAFYKDVIKNRKSQ